MKNGFPAESVNNGSVLVVKTHEWGPVVSLSSSNGHFRVNETSIRSKTTYRPFTVKIIVLYIFFFQTVVYYLTIHNEFVPLYTEKIMFIETIDPSVLMKLFYDIFFVG